MKEAFRYAWYHQLYQIHKSVNGFFYYLRRIPFLGQFIPETIFKSYDFKTGLFWIFGIVSVPLRFLTKGCWLALNLGLATAGINFMANHPALLDYHFEAWMLGFAFWVCCVSYFYRFSKGFDPFISQSDRDFLVNFGLSQNTYLQSQLFVEPILTTLSYLPALFLYAFLAKGWFYLPIGLLTVPAGHFAGQAANRWFFNRKLATKRYSWQGWAVVISSFAILAGIFFFRKFLTFLAIPVFICQLVLIWGSYAYLKKQTDHADYLAHCMDQSLQTDQRVFELTKGNEYTRQGLDMQKKLTLGKGADLSHLTGMAYINALLFQRYRSILTQKFFWRIGTIFVIWLGGQILMSYSGQILNDKELLAIMPYLFMAMYALSLGRTIAQMVFVNCDISMLHYPFYRQGKNIISGFNYRWMQSFKYNICFATGIFLLLLGWAHFQYSPQLILLLALLLVSLTALLSFHDLFIYYVLQPFTKDMEVVNPFYKVLSHGVYWIAYFNMRFDVNSSLYVYVVSILLLLYVGIGYIILLKIAPKTFVLK